MYQTAVQANSSLTISRPKKDTLLKLSMGFLTKEWLFFL